MDASVAGLDLATAVRMATAHPAELLDIHPGRLDVGEPANLVAFDLVEPSEENQPLAFEPRATLFDGRLVWGTV